MTVSSVYEKRGFKGTFVAVVTTTTLLVLAILILTPMAGNRWVAGADAESDAARSADAATARYAAMDAFYGATIGENAQRSAEAATARYAAMDAFYAATSGENLQRSQDASAARYEAMGSPKAGVTKDVADKFANSLPAKVSNSAEPFPGRIHSEGNL